MVIGLAFAGLFGVTLSAYAACSNPSPLPSGYAAPCPVFSVSPSLVAQTGTLALAATPQAGTDYIYTTAYYARGTQWLATTLTGNNAAPSYSSGPATGALSSGILSTLPIGTNYVVLWDWLWDATAQCYKGPGLNQCNTGTWRLQTFTLTQSTSGPAVSISPTTVTFPATQVGTTSPPQTFTVTNIGTAIVTLLNGNTISGDFGFAGVGTCANSLAPGASCTYSAKFTPTAIGNRTGQEVIFNNAPTSPQTISLTGTGVSTYTYSQAAYTGYTYSQAAYTQGCSNCNNYYVSASGSDSNNGSQGSPWKTINHADSAFSLGGGGTVIHVADGTYSQSVIVSRGGSSPSVRLVIQCDNGVASAVAAQGHCKINPSGLTAMELVNGSNIDIRGFDIGGNPDLMTGIDGVPCGSKGHSRCLDSVHILGNYLHDLAQNAPTDSNGCVLLGHSPGAILFPNTHGYYVNDTQVIGNMIIRIGPSRKNGCNTGPNGMYIVSKGATIQNNLIVHVHMWGMQVYGQDCDQVVTNNTIITATFGMNTTGDGEGVCTSLGHNTIANNILLDTISSKIWGSIGCDSSHPNLVAHNISDGVGGDFDRTPLSCTTVSPNPWVHASGSSLFVNYQTDGTGDYHLKSGSPAIDAGTTQCTSGGISPCTPSTDITGKTRPNPPSIGAYEQ